MINSKSFDKDYSIASDQVDTIFSIINKIKTSNPLFNEYVSKINSRYINNH